MNSQDIAEIKESLARIEKLLEENKNMHANIINAVIEYATSCKKQTAASAGEVIEVIRQLEVKIKRGLG